MIGAKDLAFPRINLLSWYLYIIGGSFMLYAILAGGVDTGWTFYTPLSTAFSNTNVVTAGLGIFITGFSSILTGLNFVVTIHRMRAPGMTWSRLPLFIWSHYATSIVMLLGTPVIAITLLLVVFERTLHVGIFDPKLGGDPLLFQHLFWFYSHPAVYIMILPSMGVVSEVMACFTRKRIFGYTFVAMSSIAIAVFGFLVWAHHMFVASMSIYAALMFSFLSYLVAVPSAIKVFNWTATMYKGSISFDTPMLYALGFIGLFTIGGMTGLFLAALGSMCTSPIPILSSPTSTTSWSAARSWDTWRDAFLVAQDLRAHVSGRLGQAGGVDCVRRIQPHLLPAICAGLHGHAASLLGLLAFSGISGSERAFDRWRNDPCGRLFAADGLFPVVDALWATSACESVGSLGPGVDDAISADHFQL